MNNNEINKSPALDSTNNNEYSADIGCWYNNNNKIE